MISFLRLFPDVDEDLFLLGIIESVHRLNRVQHQESEEKHRCQNNRRDNSHPRSCRKGSRARIDLQYTHSLNQSFIPIHYNFVIIYNSLSYNLSHSRLAAEYATFRTFLKKRERICMAPQYRGQNLVKRYEHLGRMKMKRMKMKY